MSEEKVQISILANGPAIVKGDFQMTGADGSPLAEGKNQVAICRCGASTSKPFCDGAHGKAGFVG